MSEMAVLGTKASERGAQREDMIPEDRKAKVHMLRSSHRESGGSNLRGIEQQSGRQEKRLTLAVPLWLTSLDQPGELDWTVTENVSERGARIQTKRRWRVNESVLVSLPPNFSAYGRVVYCQSLPSGNYVMGIEIGESSAAWLKSLEGVA
jgi:PilZ domain